MSITISSSKAIYGATSAIYENAVAQQLKLAGLDPHCFSWTETKDSTVYSYEVDLAFERIGRFNRWNADPLVTMF